MARCPLSLVRLVSFLTFVGLTHTHLGNTSFVYVVQRCRASTPCGPSVVSLCLVCLNHFLWLLLSIGEVRKCLVPSQLAEHLVVFCPLFVVFPSVAPAYHLRCRYATAAAIGQPCQSECGGTEAFGRIVSAVCVPALGAIVDVDV